MPMLVEKRSLWTYYQTFSRYELESNKSSLTGENAPKIDRDITICYHCFCAIAYLYSSYVTYISIVTYIITIFFSFF